MRTIGVEGQGMQLSKINGFWSEQNAGGCSNHPTYCKNPAFAVNVKAECEVMFRLNVTSQTMGGFRETDPEKFDIHVAAYLYRTNATSFPLPPDKVPVKSMRHPTLATNNEHYTGNLSAVVTKKTKVAPGVYVLVPTTFHPHQYGDFEVLIYSAGNFIQTAPYSHTT